MPATTILLAPGASGSVERLGPHARGLRARGLTVELVPLPKGAAERAVPVLDDAMDRIGRFVAERT